ncbi:MAG: gluconokinase [Syntrophaceae bacterium]|nr:gluconokinase [Syntrophaceae bacterium]
MSSITPDRAESPYILSIDIGTSAVRAFLFDRIGRAISGIKAREPLEIRTTPEGASEADPDLILERTWRCIDSVMEQASPLSQRIGGVASCTFVGNILGLNRSNQAITPLITYADTRAYGEVAGLQAEFDERIVHDRTGCHFHPCYLPAFFRWFAKARPDLFKQVTRWISIGEYLELKLFGGSAVTYSVASWSGLLNRNSLTWDEPLMAALPIRMDQLSPLVDSKHFQKGLRPEFANRWPVLKDIPWFPALGDGAAANIGSGCLSPDRVALTVGTTSALRAVVDFPIPHIPKGLWCYRVDSRRSLPGGALSEGGGLFSWLIKTLNLPDLSEVEEALARIEPDAHGLTVLPFLAGERAPNWAGHARATIHGLSLATTPLEILRAGLEAVAYRIAIVFELLRQILPSEPQIVASGGALIHSSSWLQIIADTLGRPLAISEVQEASNRGVALLALESLGVLKNLNEAPDFIGPVFDPDLKHRERYQKAIERQKRLYEKLMRS